MFGGNGLSGPAGFILGRMSCQYSESLQRNIRQALHGAAPPHFNELEEQVRLISRLTEALNLANAHSDKLESQLEDWKDYAHGLESQIRELKDHFVGRVLMLSSLPTISKYQGNRKKTGRKNLRQSVSITADSAMTMSH